MGRTILCLKPKERPLHTSGNDVGNTELEQGQRPSSRHEIFALYVPSLSIIDFRLNLQGTLYDQANVVVHPDTTVETLQYNDTTATYGDQRQTTSQFPPRRRRTA